MFWTLYATPVKGLPTYLPNHLLESYRFSSDSTYIILMEKPSLDRVPWPKDKDIFGYYDGPILFAAMDRKGDRYVFVMTDDDRDKKRYVYLAIPERRNCDVREEFLKADRVWRIEQTYSGRITEVREYDYQDDPEDFQFGGTDPILIE